MGEKFQETPSSFQLAFEHERNLKGRN